MLPLSPRMIIFVFAAAVAVVITLIVALAMVYISCSRPSRIHQQFPIEYLNSIDLMNYSDETLTSPSLVTRLIDSQR
jgi:hypothetical protein